MPGRNYVSQSLTVGTLAREIGERQGIGEHAARAVLADALESIVRSLKTGRRVHLAGLGTLKTKNYKGQNHTTCRGQCDVPARAYPVFKPAKHLRSLPPREELPEVQHSGMDECPLY